MNTIRTTIAKGIFAGAMSVGLERQPQDAGVKTVGSGQTFEEPSAEAPAPPAIIEIPLNRELRRALGTPKGRFAAYVADISVEMAALQESIESHYSSTRHRAQSTHRKLFQ